MCCIWYSKIHFINFLGTRAFLVKVVQRYRQCNKIKAQNKVTTVEGFPILLNQSRKSALKMFLSYISEHLTIQFARSSIQPPYSFFVLYFQTAPKLVVCQTQKQAKKSYCPPWNATVRTAFLMKRSDLAKYSSS